MTKLRSGGRRSGAGDDRVCVPAPLLVAEVDGDGAHGVEEAVGDTADVVLASVGFRVTTHPACGQLTCIQADHLVLECAPLLYREGLAHEVPEVVGATTPRERLPVDEREGRCAPTLAEERVRQAEIHVKDRQWLTAHPVLQRQHLGDHEVTAPAQGIGHVALTGCEECGPPLLPELLVAVPGRLVELRDPRHVGPTVPEVRMELGHLANRKPNLVVGWRLELAADLGFDVGSVAMQLRGMVEGIVPTRLREGDKEYDIRVRLAPQYRDDFDTIGRTPLYSWVVWAFRQLPVEPLLAARLVSAACGVATAALIVVLGRSLLGSQYGLAGAVL